MRAVSLILVFLAAACVAGRMSAHAFVVSVYRQHADAQRGDAPWSAARCPAVFSRRLCGLLEADRRAAGGEVPRLDGDPLYDAQAISISDLRVVAESAGSDRARVGVTFRNFDDPRALEIALVREPGGWRIDEITYHHSGVAGRTLSAILTAPR